MTDNYIQIDDSILDNILYNSVMKIPENVPIRKDIFCFLYNTGIRINEVFNVLLWQELQDGSFLLNTSKRGSYRIIDKSLIPGSLQYYYINRKIIEEYTIKCIAFDIEKFVPKFFFNTKKTIHRMHSFRYNYLKRMYPIYNDMEQLKRHIGHISVNNTTMYVNAEIFINDITALP